MTSLTFTSVLQLTLALRYVVSPTNIKYTQITYCCSTNGNEPAESTTSINFSCSGCRKETSSFIFIRTSTDEAKYSELRSRHTPSLPMTSILDQSLPETSKGEYMAIGDKIHCPIQINVKAFLLFTKVP